MSPKFVKALQFVVFLLIGLGLLYIAFRGIDLNELVIEIRQANYFWVAVSMIFAVLALVFRTFRWRLLIEPLNRFPKKINIFHAINVGYMANFVFPRIGEITRCGVLNRTDNIPVGSLFGTVIVERIFDLMMAVLMMVLLLLLRFNAVGGFIIENIMQPLLSKLPGLGWMIAIFALLTLTVYILFKIFRKRLSKIRIFRKIRVLLWSVVNGIKSAYRIRNFGWFIVLNFLVYVMYFLQTYVLFFALESTSSLGLGDALFLMVLSALALILPVQGGIGAYHWIISMGLTIFGLTREEGMVYATISHSVTSILLILLGALSLIFVFYGSRNKKN